MNKKNKQTSSSDLSLPASLSKETVVSIRSLINKHIPDLKDAQILLDELQGAMSAREIRNPAGYFRILIKARETGNFEAQYAALVREKRVADKRNQLMLEESRRQAELKTLRLLGLSTDKAAEGAL